MRAACINGYTTCFICVYIDAAEGIVQGFQHYIVMLGTTVIIPSILVPLMGGGDVSINISLILIIYDHYV